MESVTILGPGGVGGFLAGALWRAGHPVRVVARESTAEHVNHQGLTIESRRLGNFVAHPPALSEVAEELDVLLVATKAAGLEEGLRRIRTGAGLVVPLLNGLDHLEVLRGRFGAEHVAAGTIRIEADRPAPGRVLQTSPFLRVDLAADRATLVPGLERLAGMLEAAGVPARVDQSEAQILWSKLVRLNALALTSSAADRPIGFIRTDPEWRLALRQCIEEASAVAAADGAEIDPEARLAELVQAHPELGSSMQRDIAAGREPELDAIAGAVLRAAQRHQLSCPTIARLTLRVAERAGISPPAAARAPTPAA